MSNFCAKEEKASKVNRGNDLPRSVAGAVANWDAARTGAEGCARQSWAEALAFQECDNFDPRGPEAWATSESRAGCG